MNDQKDLLQDGPTANGAAVRFKSLSSLRAAHNDLLKRHREDGDTPEFLAEAEALIRDGRVTGLLLDDEDDRWAAQGLLDYWSTLLYRSGREPPDATLADFNLELAPELDDALCPYLGLDAFGEANHEVFFGRGPLVDDMLRRLQEERLLAVIGPSGSGKSSVVLAGLLPALKAGALPDSQDWHYYPPMVLGSKPLLNLAHLLQPPGIAGVEWDPQQAERLQHDPGELTRLANERGMPGVFILDQFEELFTLCRDDHARYAFIDNLLGLIQTPEARHTVILTMRIDFEPNVALLPTFQASFEKAVVRVTPLSAGELRDAIEEPARLVGLKYEAGIVDALVQDILGEPAALPLLQFTLLKLWDERERNRVTWEAYRRLGGARQALARSADEFYERLIPQDQITARRILLRMVRPGEGLEVTSQRIRREALYQAAEARDWVDRVLDKLIQARLVRLTQGETAADDQVEVAHEALVRNWPRLVDWLDEERESLRRRQRLTAAAEQWEVHGRDVGALLRGRLLEEAESYQDLDALESEFVRASRQAAEKIEREKEAARQHELEQARALAKAQRDQAEAERQRAETEARSASHLRWLAIALAAVTVCLIVAVIWALTERQKAVSQELATRATVNFDKDPQQSLMQAMKAIMASDTIEAADALRQALGASRVRAILGGKTPPVNVLAFSPDGQLLATAGADGNVHLWDADTGKPRMILEGHPSLLNVVAFSRDGALLAAANSNGEAWLWDLESGKELATLAGHTSGVNALDFSPDGRLLATAGADGRVHLWDADTGKQKTTLEDDESSGVIAIAFRPDGAMLATARSDGTARLWDPETGEERATLKGHTSGINALAFSPNGHLLATASSDFTARLWDAETGEEWAILAGHTSGVNALAFNSDGSQLATGSTDTTARLWDVSSAISPIELAVLEGHGDRVNAVAFSSDGRLLATASADGTAGLWNAETRKLWTFLEGHTSSVNVVAFNPECGGSPEVAAEQCGALLATASSDSTARLWDIPGGEAQILLPPQKGILSGVAISSDGSGGSLLATGDQDGQIWLWKAMAPLGSGDGAKEIAHWKSRGNLNRLTFSPDGGLLATGHDDGVVRLWNISTAPDQDDDRAPVAELRGHKGLIAGLAFSPDGGLLATAGEDGTDPRLWDVSHVLDGESEIRQIAVLKGHRGDAFGVAFSPDGKLLATSGVEDTTVRLWDVATAVEQSDSVTETTTLRSSEGLTFLAFSPDSRRLAAGGIGGLVHLWDVWEAPELYGDDQEFAILPGHKATVIGMAFGPNGRFLATGSGDGTARLWDVSDARTSGGEGAEVAVYQGHEGDVHSAVFSPDGGWLVTGSDDGTVRLWAIGIEPLKHSACRRASRNLALTEWWEDVDGKKEYRKICQERPDHSLVVDIKLNQAREYVRRGKYRRALRAVRQAAAQDPEQDLVPDVMVVRMLLEQARELARRGEHEQALASLRWAVALDPKQDLSPEAEVARMLIAQGQEHAEDRKYEPALAVLRQAVELDPELETTQAQDLARVHFKICRNSRLDGLNAGVQTACQQAQDLAAQISFGQTVTGTLKAGQSYLWAFQTPANQVITINMDHLDHDQRRLDSYLALYGPDGILLGEDDDSAGGYDSQLDNIVNWETGPHFIVAEGVANSAGAYRLTLGREAVSESVAAGMLVEQGREYFQVGKYEQALAALRQAVDLNPALNLEVAQMLAEQGREYSQEGKYEQALSALRQALELDSELGQETQRIAFETLVTILGPLAEAGEDQAADEALRAALDLAKSRPAGANGTWNNLCWWGSVYGFAGQVVDGACQRAVEHANEENVEQYIASSRDGRGLARALSGDVSGAIDDFAFFVEWGRNNGEYLEYLPTRAEWIERLGAGEDPAHVFTEETLENLKFQ